MVSTATCNANVAISFLIDSKSTLVNDADGIVPVTLAPGILVKLVALIAGNVPVKFAAGKLVKLLPSPK